MVDEPPMTDGTKDAVYANSASLGDDAARVTLVSDPRNLHVFIETTRPQLTVTFQEEQARRGETAASGRRPAASGGAAPDGDDERQAASKAKKKKGNDRGEEDPRRRAKDKAAAPPPEPVFTRGGKLRRHAGRAMHRDQRKRGAAAGEGGVSRRDTEFKQGEGDVWTVEVRIPYTFVPAQNAWINGVDFGRYKVGIDTAPQQTVTILSDASRVQTAAGAGRARARSIIGTRSGRRRGVIPSGWHTPTVKAGGWAHERCRRLRAPAEYDGASGSSIRTGVASGRSSANNSPRAPMTGATACRRACSRRRDC